MDYIVRAAEKSKSLREGEQAISPEVEGRSSVFQPQVCSQVSHPLYLQPRIPESLLLCLQKPLYRGAIRYIIEYNMSLLPQEA